eukprot:6306653-Pyramimonas_sp.AAC.1
MAAAASLGAQPRPPPAPARLRLYPRAACRCSHCSIGRRRRRAVRPEGAPRDGGWGARGGGAGRPDPPPRD